VRILCENAPRPEVPLLEAMRVPGIFLVSVLPLICAEAQVQGVEPPVDLDVLVEGIGNPILTDVPSLTKEIQSRGINFDLDNHLTQILRAGVNGKRDADQMATLVEACLQACQDCRARYLTRMTKEDLITLKRLRFSPEAILYEAKVRGVDGIEKSEIAATELRAAGFSEDLVNLIVPDEQIPIGALDGYTQLPLQRAAEYDPSATEGWLRVTAELPPTSESEFKFKHNGLFVKALKGAEPKILSCHFNKPAPRDKKVELVDVKQRGLEAWDEKHKTAYAIDLDKKVKGKPPMEVTYLEAGTDHRNVFRIVVRNSSDHSQQRFTFYFSWEVLRTPKTSSASLN
jgi:hypothetical protein